MIIGFVGLMGSGKTTACDILKKHWGEGVAHINFKDGLVAEMRERLPDVLEELAFIYDRTVDELFTTKPPAMRALMQNYGTEVRRKDDPNYWTSQWIKAALNTNEGDHVICDDVRFLNEAETIKLGGGILVRLVRTDVTRTGDHSSETQQSQIEVDHTITVGEGELAKLEQELLRIVEEYTPVPVH